MINDVLLCLFIELDFIPFLCKVEHKREKLLSHPLVQSLIYAKWRRFGRHVYYSKLFLYILFLFFLTGYVVVSTPLNPEYKMINETKKCIPKPGVAQSLKISFFISAGQVIVCVLAAFQLLLEVGSLSVFNITHSLFSNSKLQEQLKKITITV